MSVTCSALRKAILFVGGAVSMHMALWSQMLPVAQTLTPAQCSSLAIGADVSYLPQAEQQGKTFLLNGKPTEGLTILRSKGYNWVRLRLFVNPSPSDVPNNLAYTIAEAQKAKAMGYNFVLDLHYSDTWADPTKQGTPAAWRNMNHTQLVAAVYAYTKATITAFRLAGVQPNIVQIGNEVSNGILWPDGQLPYNWSNFLDLAKAGVQGLQDATSPINRPLIMFHEDHGANMWATKWFFDHLVAAGVPFDVVGLSYYPWWQGSMADMQTNLNSLASLYKKPVVIIEAAYNWVPGNYLYTPGPYPETPAGQKAFLLAVAQAVAAVPNGLGAGVFWWEPAVNDVQLAKRGLFDLGGNPLPALSVFEPCAPN